MLYRIRYERRRPLRKRWAYGLYVNDSKVTYVIRVTKCGSAFALRPGMERAFLKGAPDHNFFIIIGGIVAVSLGAFALFRVKNRLEWFG